MPKFISLGEKWDAPTVTAPEKKNELHYPGFSIRDKEGFDIDVSLAGKEIEAVVKLKVRSVEKRITDKGKKSFAEFDVMAIKFENLPTKSLQDKIEEGLEENSKQEKA